eukprot:TRINITY_DN3189_c0_g1_i4.p1 TRINITY_DN3189_c0_g1~~TRINITY_DN3189_c0_g1_i4.p1  ORF type:complete len:121 (-),score=1.10 TRINITY_DN3189_c0_g1_i4:1635-1997(-)
MVSRVHRPRRRLHGLTRGESELESEYIPDARVHQTHAHRPQQRLEGLPHVESESESAAPYGLQGLLQNDSTPTMIQLPTTLSTHYYIPTLSASSLCSDTDAYSNLDMLQGLAYAFDDQYC